MFFRQVLHEDLGCASYLVADGGEAAVIDPKWDVEDYLALADEHGFRIAHVLETHNHADHVSGKGRLQKATGAVIHVPAGAGVAFEHEPMADGDAVAVGGVRIEALATPGHRPEHTAYVISDAARGEEPWLVVTGDSLFVGDVARPDLAVEPEEGARELFASLNRLLELDDFAEAWPGHIGGSLCGGAGMSEKPGTTIGFERRFNRLLRLGSEQDFVRELTGHLSPQPPNFKRIVELNKGPLLTEAAVVEPLAPARVKEMADAGVLLLDGRPTRDFDAEHVPGSVNVTMTRSSVGTRAAWIADPEADVLLNAASEDEARTDGPPARGRRLPEDRRLPLGRHDRLARGRLRDRVDDRGRRARPRGADPKRRGTRPRRARRGRVGGEPRPRLDPHPLPRAPERRPGRARERRQAARRSSARPETAARSPRRS